MNIININIVISQRHWSSDRTLQVNNDNHSLVEGKGLHTLLLAEILLTLTKRITSYYYFHRNNINRNCTFLRACLRRFFRIIILIRRNAFPEFQHIFILMLYIILLQIMIVERFINYVYLSIYYSYFKSRLIEKWNRNN